MSAYLGTLGRLVPIWATGTLPIEGHAARTFTTTLEGRVKAQIKPVGRRTWQLQAGQSRPGEQADLMDFVNGVWGNGPFIWVPGHAPFTNLLTPEVASCGPVAAYSTASSVAGPLLLPDGSWAGRSLVNATPAVALFFGPATVPVLPNESVTASAYLVGNGAKCGVQFYTSAGTPILAVTSAASGVAGTATRLSVTRTAPANAAACAVYGLNATQGARPAITWTTEAVQWADGQGCNKAIVEALGREIIVAHPHDDNWANAKFTIREVG